MKGANGLYSNKKDRIPGPDVIIPGLSWSGMLTKENIKDVIGAMYFLLANRKFTYVFASTLTDFAPKARFHQELVEVGAKKSPFKTMWSEADPDAFELNITCAYQMRFITFIAKQRFDPGFNSPYIMIDAENGQINTIVRWLNDNIIHEMFILE